MIEAWLQGVGDFFVRPPWRVIVDLADILLVAFILYRALLLLRGTRAMQMGIGLALVFFVYQLSLRIGLTTVWSLLDTILTYVVLIIVVVFQADIRRALMRVGRRPLFHQGRQRDHHTLDEVIQATEMLANKKLGALIVFEREAALDEFLEPGTDLDAIVSKEVLFSIFIPSFENPTHDGAVIIRDGRIAQAGSFLPLARSPRLDRTLGTRHRAAIGISEETDAVAIVVSEERATVAVCVNGNIIRGLSGSSLRNALSGIFFRQRQSVKKANRGTEDRSTPTHPPVTTGAPSVAKAPTKPAQGTSDPGRPPSDPDSSPARAAGSGSLSTKSENAK